MVANDNPFNVGDRVAIIRIRHGWHDGRLEGTIVSRYVRPTGTYSYSASVEDSEIGDYEVDIEHTRDAYLIRK